MRTWRCPSISFATGRAAQPLANGLDEWVVSVDQLRNRQGRCACRVRNADHRRCPSISFATGRAAQKMLQPPSSSLVSVDQLRNRQGRAALANEVRDALEGVRRSASQQAGPPIVEFSCVSNTLCPSISFATGRAASTH